MSISCDCLFAEPVELSTELKIKSPYFLGMGVVSQFVERIASYSFDKLFVITNPVVNGYYGREFLEALSGFNVQLIILPDGEIHKNMKNLNFLCEELIKRDVSKGSILIAFGGGVIGNIVGLAAALIYRGIRFVEVPTTFLAQTDSTLSNKQAVNGEKGKNLFGIYHAPIFVWTDVKYLLSEDPVRIQSGLVESVKNGLISDPAFLQYLDEKILRNAVYSSENLFELVYRSVVSKVGIIKRDPSEKGYGMVLEYGHTFGHALEKIKRGALTHGEAVAIGMVIAAQLSRKLGYLKDDDVAQHIYFLKEKLGLGVGIPEGVGVKDIITTMRTDNKKSSRGTKFVLLKRIGEVMNPDGDYMVSVPGDLVETAIQEVVSL